MDRWRGRVALVTGASAGIGAAIALDLARSGLTVVAMARNADRLQNLAKKAQGKLHTVSGDVAKEGDILRVFKWIRDNLGGVDVLVNNAGCFPHAELTDFPTEKFVQMLDVNVLGLTICTREAVKDMRERKVDDGHIIHIGSMLGHQLPNESRMAFYGATKHAVRALTEGLRKDLVAKKSKIRVSAVSPGLVRTEGVDELGKDHSEFQELPALNSDDISAAVLYILSTPPHVQIHDIIIKPVGETL